MPTLTDPHLSLVRPVTPRTPDGCQECLVLGAAWGAPAPVPDLRARGLLRLFAAPARPGPRLRGRHPIVQSFEPGEDWRWCYVDETFV
jgi:hypothetical protein